MEELTQCLKMFKKDGDNKEVGDGNVDDMHVMMITMLIMRRRLW